MSALRIRDSASERFSLEMDRLRAVCSRRFCTAPRFARSKLTILNAASKISTSDDISSPDSFTTLTVEIPSLSRSPSAYACRASMFTCKPWLEFAPVWNHRPPFPINPPFGGPLPFSSDSITGPTYVSKVCVRQFRHLGLFAKLCCDLVRQ